MFMFACLSCLAMYFFYILHVHCTSISCVLQNYCTCRALPTQDPLLGTFQVFGRLSSATCDFVAMDV